MNRQMSKPTFLPCKTPVCVAICPTPIYLKIRGKSRGCKDGQVAKRTSYSFRGAKFDFYHAHVRCFTTICNSSSIPYPAPPPQPVQTSTYMANIQKSTHKYTQRKRFSFTNSILKSKINTLKALLLKTFPKRRQVAFIFNNHDQIEKKGFFFKGQNSSARHDSTCP